MPFRYRLQKILDFRIKKKEQQLQNVIKAQNVVLAVERKIDLNNQEISSTKINMRRSNPMMYDAFDTYLKHLYDKGEQLENERQEALQKLEEEKEKLRELEKAVKILENHKERMHEIYKEEEKQIELKRLSEVAVQKHFQKEQIRIEEELTEEEKRLLR